MRQTLHPLVALLLLLLIAVASGFVPGLAQRRPHPDLGALAHRRTLNVAVSTSTTPFSPLHQHQQTRPMKSFRTLTIRANAADSTRSFSNVLSTIRKRRPALAGPSKSDVQALASAAVFIALDVAFRRLFRFLNIAFPSSLGACSIVFAALLLLPSKAAGFINNKVLQPGAGLLAKWLPLFFVPSLITLPLADTSSLELGKVTVTIVGGFFGTLLSTAYSVQLMRKLKARVKSSRHDPTATATTTTAAAAQDVNGTAVDMIIETDKKYDDKPLSTAPPKKYSDELFHFLSILTIGSGIASWFTGMYRPATETLFFLATTLSTFCWGARLPARVTQLVHPLVTCTALTWTVLAGWARITQQTILPYHGVAGVLKSYTRSGHGGIGAGDILLFLLGPAVVSLAVSMYERRQLMRDNLAEVATGVAVSTVGGLFGTALAVRWLDLVDPFLRLSLLSRNITSPLAMAIAGIIGADVSLAVSMVVLTGLIGANFGAAILDACGVRDAVARGLGIGAAAHGLGTAAFANEKDAFPFAAIVCLLVCAGSCQNLAIFLLLTHVVLPPWHQQAMALTATAATVTVSIPLFRRTLVQLALGV